MPDPATALTTATPLAIGTTGTHTLNTATANDYYRFTLSGRSSVNLTLTGLDSNVDLQLLGRSGTMLQQSTNTGTTTDDINYTDLSAGVYYIRVAAANSTTSAHYTLGLQAQTNAKTDLLWRNYTTGENALWFMNGTSLASSTLLTQVSDPHWHLEGSADFTGDGQADLVWRNGATGENVVWQMNGTTVVTSLGLTAEPDLNWHIASVNDFDGDGQADLVWRNGATGANRVWQMQGTTAMSTLALLAVPDLNWQLVGSGDFNRDGQTDLVWRRDATGENVVWFMNGTTSLSSVFLPQVADGNWRMEGVADFNGDNQPDLVWRNYSTGQDAIWLLQGTTLLSGAGVLFTSIADLNWQIAAPFNVYAYPGLADIAGNTIATALNLGTLNGQATYHSTVSSSSSSDYYRFQLTAPDPAVSLHTSTGNLELLDSSGGLIQRVVTAGAPVAIQRALDSGSYYLRVYGTTSYVLGVFDTTAPPSVTTSLVNDTALTGTNTDHWTADPTVRVQVGTNHWLGSLTAGFNATNPASFVALTPLLGNSLTLTPTQLQAINGGLALTDGSYVLHLRATGVYDVTALTTDLAFTLDTTTSAPSGLHLTTGTGNTTNVSTPTVTGQAEVGALVKVYGAGNVLLGQGVADSNGSWQATLTALADGTYTVTAISTDVAGNVSATSAPLSLVVDTQAPSAPSFLPLDAIADTGESHSDGITRNTTPTLTGHAEAGTAITLVNQGLVVGQTRTDASGFWQIKTLPLPHGLASLSATATDAAGNVSAPSAPLLLTVDLVAPASPGNVRLAPGQDSGRSSTDGQTNVQALSVIGTAAPYTLVQLWGEGQLLGQQKADANGNWQIPTPTLADGAYYLSAFAIDLAGNRSPASLPLTLIIDTQAPTAPTLLPLSATSDTGSSDHDGVTAKANPTVAGQAAANALVQLFDQNQAIGQTITDGTGAWQFTTPALTEGNHTLTATATDVAGNVSAASTPLSLVVDTQAPSSPTHMQLASPTAGTSAAGALTKVSMPLLTGNATAGTFITLFSEGVAVGQTAVGNDGTWQVQAQTLTDGTHVLTATAKDLAGNESLATAPLTVTIDATAPVVVLDTNTDIVLTQQARLSGYVDDLGSGVVSAQYHFDGLAPVALTLDAYGDFDQAFDWTGVSNGAHTLTLTTTDVAGNGLTQTVAVTVNQGLMAPTLTAALAHDTGWDNTDGVTADPKVTGKLAGGNTSAQLRVGLDGMAAASFTTVTVASDGTFTLDQALMNTLAGGTLADGDHTLHLQARDSSGNLLSVADVALTLDKTAPTLTVTTPLTTTPLSAGAHLAGSVQETGSGLVALQYRFDNLAPLSLSLDATGHFNEWLDFTGIADGSHTLTVSSTDGAGNVTASHFNVMVQNGGTGGTVSNFLTVALVADTGTNTTDGITSNPTVTGTISAQVAKLLVGFDHAALSSFTAMTPASNGSLTLDAAALATIYGDSLPDGAHTLRFQMLDAQGTVLGVTHVAFNLDTTAPDLSLPTLIDGIAWSPGEVLQGTLNEANPGATLVYNFDSGTPTTLALDLAGGFNTVLQTLPTLPAAHTLNLLATDSAGNRQNIAYHFLIADDQPVTDTDTLGQTAPLADPKPPSGTTFVDQGQIGAAGGSDGGWGFVGAGGTWGFGGGSGTGDGWSPSHFGGFTPSSPITSGTGTPNPTDLNYIEGAGYHLDYVPALRTLLDYAEGALSNGAATVNKKAALKNRLTVLNDLAQLISSNPGAATLHDELAAVMHGIFGEVPLAGTTKGEAVKDGYLLAQDIAKDTTAVTIQVYQAELLLTVDKVLLQQGVTTTAAQQTALATALKELATTYAKLNPTAADDANTTTTPNFLDLLWRAQLPVNNQPRTGNEIAADLALGEAALTSLLAGVNQPVQAITFINNLLKAATQVVGLQGDLHDAKFIRELVDFGFEYAKLNPTGTVDAGTDAVNTFLDTLWQGGDIRAAQGGLSAFFNGLGTEAKRLELLNFEDKLLEADGKVQTAGLQNQKHDAAFIGNLVGLGSSYAALNPQSPTGAAGGQYASIDPNVDVSMTQGFNYFLKTIYFASNNQEIQTGADQLGNALNYIPNQRLELLAYEQTLNRFIAPQGGGVIKVDGIPLPPDFLAEQPSQLAKGTLAHTLIGAYYRNLHTNDLVYTNSYPIRSILEAYSRRGKTINYAAVSADEIDKNNPDIADITQKYLYEIKPYNTRQIIAGWRQVVRYLDIFNRAIGVGGINLGSDEDPGSYGTIPIPGTNEELVFHTKGKGLIVYKVIQVNNQQDFDLGSIVHTVEDITGTAVTVSGAVLTIIFSALFEGDSSYNY